MYEVAFLLDKDLSYYDLMLKNRGFVNVVNCFTRDIYWSKEDFSSLSEEEIKKSCIRFRVVDVKSKDMGQFQNYHIYDDTQDKFIYPIKDLLIKDKEFMDRGFIKVFDTKKVDHQYQVSNMKSKIQLQEIDKIGLVLYYDNPDYAELSLIKQKEMLIQELNSYGFTFKENELSIDKLRSLYFDKVVYEGENI